VSTQRFAHCIKDGSTCFIGPIPKLRNALCIHDPLSVGQHGRDVIRLAIARTLHVLCFSTRSENRSAAIIFGMSLIGNRSAMRSHEGRCHYRAAFFKFCGSASGRIDAKRRPVIFGVQYVFNRGGVPVGVIPIVGRARLICLLFSLCHGLHL